ncbi:hypothetical protein HHX48_11285 [Salinimonas sp. HHU 13199]|uniref:Tetratricopeptide repeat protein n=1 Tax=Salinimonas profundi TaxID=2729140 RepID=A0ABR8LJD2_9ALTE|nr:hypothetical protein [Salinimonas profundi]MBD3586321.1 hypothetical protein [Salinimonas profundi]
MNGEKSKAATVNPVSWQAHYSDVSVNEAAVFEPDEIYALPDTEKVAFLNWFHAPHNQSLAPHQRLAKYLEKTLHGFTYNGSTHNATEAAILDNGNCLSLAVITAALASVADIDLKFQKMNSPPVYKKQGDIMMLSSHVRTKAYNTVNKEGRDDGSFPKVLVPASVIIDYFPSYGNVKGEYVSQDAVSAMFYRNKVAVALVDNHVSKAFWLADKALKLAPNDPENVSAMAVVLRRLDKQDEAEQLYQQAIAHDITDITLLSNYLSLLSRQGREQEAAEVGELLLHQNDENPYSWITLASEHIDRRELKKAQYFLDKAKQLAPYLDDVYREQARCFFLQEKLDEAHQALTKAHQLAWDDRSRALYMAKQTALESLR